MGSIVVKFVALPIDRWFFLLNLDLAGVVISSGEVISASVFQAFLLAHVRTNLDTQLDEINSVIWKHHNCFFLLWAQPAR